MTIDFKGRTVIVTGAGRGLGRAHALAFAARGAKVLVNDLGADSGRGPSVEAEAVAEEIRAAGCDAISHGASVTDMAQVEAMVAAAMARWGRIDVLVNNAGILRDKSFAKMDLADFRDVLDVHVMGAVHCTRAVWEIMRSQAYGRIVVTSSASGLFGNFGQSNYGAAKLALVGLMQTLGIEGQKANIRVNAVVPSGATRMTADILPPDVLDLLAPERVSPAVLFLASEDAPNRCIMVAGGGSFEMARIVMTQGVHLGSGPDVPDRIAAHFAEIGDLTDCLLPANAMEPPAHEIEKARRAEAARG